MTEKTDLVRASKRISRHLRHRPDEIGIELDPAGWVEVDTLLDALGRHGRRVDRALLDEIVATSDKQRFAFDATRTRIRANQGHSVAVDLELPIAQPPAVLYHGTHPGALDAIRREGLRPMSRHHVHLSPDRDTAVRVGGRRGHPVVLEIDAAALAADGHEFRCSANGVWLVDDVPPHRLREL